jgi:hypothetical protein
MVTWQITPKRARYDALKTGPHFTRNLTSDLFDGAFYNQLSSALAPNDGTPYESRLVTTVAGVAGEPPQLFFDTKTRSALLASKRSLFAIGALDQAATDPVIANSKRLDVKETFPGVIVTGNRKWASHQFTALDGENFATAKNILITVTGDIANTDMGWKNAEKTTVGRDWGNAPVLVEGPTATIELPGGGKFKAWALDERGQRREEIQVTSGKLEIGPKFKTLWYEVERTP